MWYVIDADHKPHGLVVLCTEDRELADDVAERYAAQPSATPRRVVITREVINPKRVLSAS